MMFKTYTTAWYKFLFTTLVWLTTLNSYNQTLREVVRVEGKVKGKFEKIEQVRIALLFEGEIEKVKTTKKNGRFVFNIPLQRNYMLIFSKQGYRSKYVAIFASNIPEEDAAYGYEFGGLDVTLFKNIGGINDDILDKPVAEIVYDTELYKFTFNRSYFKDIAPQKEALEKELILLTKNKATLQEQQNIGLQEQISERAFYELKQQEAIDLMTKKQSTHTFDTSVTTIKLSTQNHQLLLAKLEQKAKDDKFQKEQRAKKIAELKARKKEKALFASQKKQPPPTTKEITKPNLENKKSASKNIYRKGNKTITEITIESNGSQIIYKKVLADWGGKYFFKDNIPITEIDFDLELEHISF